MSDRGVVGEVRSGDDRGSKSEVVKKVSFGHISSVNKGSKGVYGVKGGVHVGFVGSVGWCIGRGVDRDIYDVVGRAYVLL